MAHITEMLIATSIARYDKKAGLYRLRDGDTNLFKAASPESWGSLGVDATQIEECILSLSARRRKMSDEAAASVKPFIIRSPSNPRLKVYVSRFHEGNDSDRSLRCVLEVMEVSYKPKMEEVLMAKRKAKVRVKAKPAAEAEEAVATEEAGTAEAPETTEAPDTTAADKAAEEKKEKDAAAEKKKADKKAKADAEAKEKEEAVMAILNAGQEVLETIYEELECPEELTSFQVLFTETGLFYPDTGVYGQLQKDTGTPYKAGSVRAEIWAMLRQGAFTKDTIVEAFKTSASARTIDSVLNVGLREGTVMEVEYEEATYFVPFVFRVEEGLEEEEEEE